MKLTQKDIGELLGVLSTALSEARIRDRSGWTQEHINTYRAYMDTAQKWIHLLSQSISSDLGELTKPEQLLLLETRMSELTKSVETLQETTDLAIKLLAGHVSHLAQQFSIDHQRGE